MLNAGQICIAPGHALVPQARLSNFVDAARSAVVRLYPALADTPDYTRTISDGHCARLRSLVDDALACGARAWPLSAAQNDARRRLFAPVALSGREPDAIALQEEIFDPVLPLLGYASLDQAIAWINAQPRPLALSLFERQRATIDKVMAETDSGGMTVNGTLLHAGVGSLPSAASAHRAWAPMMARKGSAPSAM